MNRTKKKGQVMIITGATSGIGRATALEWAKRGGSVVLAARSSENLDEVALACKAAGGKSLVVQVDVSREEDVLKLTEKAVNTYGKIDIWLNKAAAMIFGGFNQIPTEDFHRILETNLFGIIYASLWPMKFWELWNEGKINRIEKGKNKVKFTLNIPYQTISGNGNLREVSCSNLNPLDEGENLDKEVNGLNPVEKSNTPNCTTSAAVDSVQRSPSVVSC
jgi:hypothetical protein